ncbi:MAG: helix-turn-helix transcriptional regulator [Eubacteriales bacterium]
MLERQECLQQGNQCDSNSKNNEIYPELINNAIELINKNYAELYGVEEIAEELMVCKCHLVRAFSAATGLPPGKYLTSVRISKAKMLLVNKDYSVEVIATLSGFSGANYFCKVFKKSTGKSPLAYKNNMNSAEHEPEMTEMEKRLFI